jgi:ribosomal protein L11 methyltransferase
VRSVLFHIDVGEQQDLILDLWEHGTTGIWEDGTQVRAFFEDVVDLTDVTHRYPDAIVEENAEQESPTPGVHQRDWDPIFVGTRFFIAPPWVNQPTPEGRLRLSINAGIAFGTGRHESTQLMLEALESELPEGATVFDVGCGSGILSLAAGMLGARYVFGCDIDPNSAVSAREHLSTKFFIGSIDAVANRCADLVLANISARVLDTLAYDFKRISTSSASILLAGFLCEDPPKQFRPRQILERDGWQCWICRPDDIVVAPNHSGSVKIHATQWW